MSLPVVPTSNSQGQIGLGTVLSIGPAASATGTPAYTPIGEVLSADPSGGTRNVVKWTELDNLYAQKRSGTIDAGELTMKVARVATDAGQIALKAAWLDATGQPYLFKVQLYPNTAAGQATTGDSGVFPAIISKYNELGSLNPEGLIQTEFTLDITGPMTVTPGS